MAIAEYKHCPACERSRGDLGMGQACPDCGCPPTDALTIIRQSRTAADALLVAGAVLFLIAAADKDLGRWTPAALFALAVILIVTRFLVAKRRRRAVLWKGGCALVDWENAPQRLIWADFASVTADVDRGVIGFSGIAGEALEIPIHFFGSRSRALGFVAASADCLGDRHG